MHLARDVRLEPSRARGQAHVKPLPEGRGSDMLNRAARVSKRPCAARVGKRTLNRSLTVAARIC